MKIETSFVNIIWIGADSRCAAISKLMTNGSSANGSRVQLSHRERWTNVTLFSDACVHCAHVKWMKKLFNRFSPFKWNNVVNLIKMSFHKFCIERVWIHKQTMGGTANERRKKIVDPKKLMFVLYERTQNEHGINFLWRPLHNCIGSARFARLVSLRCVCAMRSLGFASAHRCGIHVSY